MKKIRDPKKEKKQKIKNSLLVRCADARCTGSCAKEIARMAKNSRLYQLTRLGGAGVLASLKKPDSLIEEIEVAIPNLNIEEIFLTLHGKGKKDKEPCKAYLLQEKLQDHVSTSVKKSDAFLSEELQKAHALLRKRGITIPIRAFRIEFTASGKNILHEVKLVEEESYKLAA